MYTRYALFGRCAGLLMFCFVFGRFLARFILISRLIPLSFK